MMFFKFVKNDIKEGFYQNRWKYLLTFSIFLCLSFYHFLTLRIYEISNPEYFSTKPTVGDYLATIIGGYGQYELNSDNFVLFSMPIMWVILILWSQYSGLYYPFRDLNGIGKHLILLSGQRGAWWSSKCIWSTLNIATVCGLAFLGCTVTGLLCGASFSMEINSYLPAELKVDITKLTEPTWNIGSFALGCVLVMMCFSILQLSLSLIIRPMFAYLVLAGYAVASTYIQSPFLIGNYMMFARSGELVTNGMGFWDGIVICLWLIVICFVLGYLYFERMDILGGEW